MRDLWLFGWLRSLARAVPRGALVGYQASSERASTWVSEASSSSTVTVSVIGLQQT